MFVSLKWLRDYVDLPDDIDVDDLAHRLTMASAEVEGIRRVGQEWDRELIRVGHVLAVEPHPDADRLRLATVDWGGEEPQRVVCGAPNLAVGQRVAFAREGARIIDGRSGKHSKLKASKIRGVESAGMVLSEAELGISEAHEGIIELPADAPVGAPLAGYLGDTILDVHTWPNRPDTMNMIGIAREVAAIIGGTVRPIDDSYAEQGAEVGGDISIVVDEPSLCARFVATLTEDITIRPSPQWMQERLIAAGMRPISNVVDITNYVMLEVGQPLHAYDADLVQGPIVVRLAREGERLRTLDGQDRELTPDMLLITDDSGPIGLAGVMGGASTEVNANTTRVLLEGAHWEPATIRRTSTRLALRSEASARFERNLPHGMAMAGVRRATQLFVQECGGTARRGHVDVYPTPGDPVEVTLTRKRLDTVLGFAVPTDEATTILDTLGFETHVSNAGESGDGAGETFRVRPPWWRTDITIPDDVAEEIVRLAGYDRLPATTIRGRIAAWAPQPLVELRERLRDALVEVGMQEVVTYSLTTDEVLGRVIAPEELALIRPLRLRNTLSSDREVMRPTLRHSLIEVVDRNIRAGAPRIAAFEAGRVYLPRRADGAQASEALPDEREMVTGVVSGSDADRWGRPVERTLDFFDAKGMLDAAMTALGVTLDYEADHEFGFLPGRLARLSAGGEPVGLIGELHPETLDAFDVAQPVTLFEIDVARLLPHVPERVEARPVSRFPAVEQDLALVLDEDVPASAVQAVIEGSGLVASSRVFDVYRGDQLPAGKKSIAFAIRYQVPNRTLTGEDANREQAKIVKRLAREFGAELRG